MYLVGSSLGGYYANYFSEKYNLPCVLMNPLIDVSKMKQFINEGFTMNDINNLPTIKYISGNRKLVMLCTGDDIFDYKVSRAFFENTANVKVINNSNHRFSDLCDYVDLIEEFITWQPI